MWQHKVVEVQIFFWRQTCKMSDIQFMFQNGALSVVWNCMLIGWFLVDHKTVANECAVLQFDLTLFWHVQLFATKVVLETLISRLQNLVSEITGWHHIHSYIQCNCGPSAEPFWNLYLIWVWVAGAPDWAETPKPPSPRPTPPALPGAHKGVINPTKTYISPADPGSAPGLHFRRKSLERLTQEVP